MPSTNGHGPQRAIIYTRVSGDEQKKKGYSLSDQHEALWKWCEAEGYEVIEEVEDAAWSGGFLERPGLDRVRELVAAGGVDAVVVLFRDRIARGVYTQLLQAEFATMGHIEGLIDQRRKLVESEAKRLERMHQMARYEDVALFVRRVFTSVRQHVQDQDALDAIANDIHPLIRDESRP